jgi:hypothetical protein
LTLFHEYLRMAMGRYGSGFVPTRLDTRLKKSVYYLDLFAAMGIHLTRPDPI